MKKAAIAVALCAAIAVPQAAAQSAYDPYICMTSPTAGKIARDLPRVLTPRMTRAIMLQVSRQWQVKDPRVASYYVGWVNGRLDRNRRIVRINLRGYNGPGLTYFKLSLSFNTAGRACAYSRQFL